jgi:DNA-binding helix-hairpin-helix protein with protein kinase domain
MRLLLERRGDEISLLPALKRGGEGSIHPIIGEPGLVAKVFTEPGQERAEKLQAMIANPPVVTTNAPVLLAWPVDRILNVSGGCIGYVLTVAE